MQITIVQHEIEDAIRAYVLNHVSIPNEQAVNIEMKAGRSEDGFTATISVIRPSTTVEAPLVTDAVMSAIQAEEVRHPQVRKAPDFGPRTTIPKAAPKAAAPAEPAEVESPATTAQPEADTGPAQAGAVEGAAPAEAVAEVQAAPEAAKAVAPTKTIFPTIGTSAPAGIAGGVSSPKPAAKSLFANLTPPVHDTPAAPTT